MIKAIELKVFELINRFSDLKNEERGQTSAEYVAVTAVAVAIAIGVIYGVLSTQLSAAVETIAGNITEFVNNPS